ncbi:MAG: preprotein translocase subunit SecY [Cytophagaceae bacterium]|jgi:preprotein translocase subunit SecY|nr:preprotein translocase subunit SecY [Cytophagaceae bacterium]
MKKFFTTIKNIWSIEELRTRLIYTLGLLLVFRLGSFIVLPGIDATKVGGDNDSEGVLGLLNAFSGGAFNNVSVLGLGIMPYITASIVIQLLTFAVPYFQKLQKEGDSGRKKINNFTRIFTVFVAAAQSVGYLATYVKPEHYMFGMNTPMFDFTRIICLVAGTMFCLWLGEKITDKGIGNGISMLIMVGIVSRLPAAFIEEITVKGMKGSIIVILEVIALFFVVMAVVAITQAVRRIQLQFAKQMVGNQAVGGRRQYLPLKLIGAGVMPIIFAQSALFLPSVIGSFFRENETIGNISAALGDFTSWEYNVTTALLIIIFTFFYTAITFNPKQISDDIKRSGGYIPGVKPGDATAEEIDNILSRLTLPGAIFLAIIAALPAFAVLLGVERNFAYFFGGTSLLIMVGVVLDTLQQIETYLLNKKYDGMMSTGRVRGRTEEATPIAQ